jgi:hypothetical protein
MLYVRQLVDESRSHGKGFESDKFSSSGVVASHPLAVQIKERAWDKEEFKRTIQFEKSSKLDEANRLFKEAIERETEILNGFERNIAENFVRKANLYSRRMLCCDLVANIMIRKDERGIIYADVMEDGFNYQENKAEK